METEKKQLLQEMQKFHDEVIQTNRQMEKGFSDTHKQLCDLKLSLGEIKLSLDSIKTNLSEMKTNRRS